MAGRFPSVCGDHLMRQNKWLIYLDCALFIGVLLAWMAARSDEQAPILTDFEPSQFYAVKTHEPIEIPLNADAQYGVIVSNLDSQAQQVHVKFSPSPQGESSLIHNAYPIRPIALSNASAPPHDSRFAAATKTADEERSFFCM